MLVLSLKIFVIILNQARQKIFNKKYEFQ